MRSLRSLVAVTLVGCCGCSLVAVRPPPREPPPPFAPLECTELKLAPALDTAGALVTPVLGLASWWVCGFVASMDGASSDRARCSPLLWGTLLSTAAFTGSAVYGFRTTGECHRLAEERPAIVPRPER
jgi:hypothetical protein